MSILRRKKKYLWFRFPTDPIFFCRPYYFFNVINRATLFSPGGCGLLPKWCLLLPLISVVVTLIIEKTMKKIFKKKIISDLPTLIFSRYETGITSIFFSCLMNIPHFGIYSVYEHAHELMFKYEAYRMLPKYQNFNTTFRGVLSIVTRGSSFSAGCCMTSVFVNLIVRPVHKINQNCATLPKDFNSYTYKSSILHTCLFSFHSCGF
jgi:hypothetical protein